MIDIMDYECKKYSQRGEDGIIECILKELNFDPGWCCEFGAWDGIHLSNTFNLFKQGWKGVLIEGDPIKFKELKWNMRNYPDVYCHNSFVSLEPGERLNNILSKYSVPCDFDILSLDIDSYDYWIWASLTYNPKVVIIEYNPNWEDKTTIPYTNPPEEWNWDQYYGASATALANLGHHKGYDLIGVVPYNNLIFVRSGLNKDLFKCVDLGTGIHLDKSHNKPIKSNQRKKLIHNPPLRWEDM